MRALLNRRSVLKSMLAGSAVAAASGITIPVIGRIAHFGTIALIGWGWAGLILGLDWSTETTIAATASTFGALAVVVAEFARRRPGDSEREQPDADGRVDPALVWGGLAVAGVLLATLLAVSDSAAPGWTWASRQRVRPAEPAVVVEAPRPSWAPRFPPTVGSCTSAGPQGPAGASSPCGRWLAGTPGPVTWT